MSTVGVMVRPDLGEAGPALRDLVAWLQARGERVCLEEKTAALVDGGVAAGCLVASGRDVAAQARAVVVLGGDGTLLAASHLVDDTVPVLGVNFGSLGFLTEITLPELYPTLEGVLKGEYRYEERRMLRAHVTRDEGPEAWGDVLNDVVVTKAALSRIIDVEVSVDGVFVSAFRADGIIVSSPTGSTAYNLAAGGPILHPTLPAIVLTPICPHMLTNRPLVVGDDSTIRLRLRPGRKKGRSRERAAGRARVAVPLQRADAPEVHITFDGQSGFPLGTRDVVTITRSPRTLRLVKAPDRDYYEVLRTKLKWGGR